MFSPPFSEGVLNQYHFFVQFLVEQSYLGLEFSQQEVFFIINVISLMNIKLSQFCISFLVHLGKSCWPRNQLPRNYIISKLSNFIGIKLFIIFLCCLFNRCKIHSGISFFIPDSGNLCLLFLFFLFSLARSLSYSQSFYRANFWICYFLLLHSCFLFL